MSLPSYKLNNSYTVYVNYFYLNDCIQAGKKHAQRKKEIDDVAKRVKKILQAQNTSSIKNVTSTSNISKAKPINKNVIRVGCTVRLLNLDTQQECSYVLEKPENVAIGTNKISSVSPIGKSLLNRQVGDRFSVEVPLGVVRYKILSFVS